MQFLNYISLSVVCIAFLLVNAATLSAQNPVRERIDRSVAEYCNCVNNAKSEEESQRCQVNRDTTAPKLSGPDSFYMLRKMARGCGDAKKSLGASSASGNEMDIFFFKMCTYFSEEDLAKFRLRLQMERAWAYGPTEYSWVHNKNGEELIGELIQETKVLTTDTTSRTAFVPDPIGYFDHLVTGVEKVPSGYRYVIIAEKKNLLCSVIVITKEKNQPLINELVAMLREKVNACDF